VQAVWQGNGAGLVGAKAGLGFVLKSCMSLQKEEEWGSSNFAKLMKKSVLCGLIFGQL
jgi:hypothetical protein